MPTYISLIKWTQKGIENVKDSPKRLDDAKDLAESFGGEITDFYLTFGEYDLVVVSEFPDDEVSAQFALTVASGGAVSFETLKAFPENDYRELIEKLSE